MKIAMCQYNSTMGDIKGNAEKVIQAFTNAAKAGADLVVFPELFLQGYPPRDLLEQQWFIDEGIAEIIRIKNASKDFPEVGILFGTASPTWSNIGKGIYNSALLIQNGHRCFSQDKMLLPTYDVFDEARYFDPGKFQELFEFKGQKLGITICEDAWNDADLWDRPLYDRDPVGELAQKGADILINISASPFNLGKQRLRYKVVESHAKRWGLPFVFVNLVGGNDEVLFDGGSMFFDKDGHATILDTFKQTMCVVDTDKMCDLVGADFEGLDTISTVRDALVMGIKDYMGKCGIKKAVVGLSGGIDSAVTCALAVDALGRENVMGITMPSRYSSEGSVSDAEKLANNLGIEFETIAIENMYKQYISTLKGLLEDKDMDTTEENLQARARGNILMAYSNKLGSIVLSTGNKSEMAVGYCTLYGDMSGGLSVISDLPKTLVYELAQYINKDGEVIPSDTITKPPSAELRPDQKDQDSLPEYDILDGVLELMIEKGLSCDQIVEKGYDRDTVQWINKAVKLNEYKRRQAAPGLRVTQKAFGMGRRFPIAARYRR